MKIIKQIGQVAYVLLLATIVIGNGVFYWRNLQPVQRELPASMVIADSIRAVQVKKKILKDKLDSLDQKEITLYAKRDSVMRLDTLGWANVRKGMRARVRADVRASL